MVAVDYKRSGCPDIDVRTSRFEPLFYMCWVLRVVERSFIGYKDV
jgi:hypothetical protein